MNGRHAQRSRHVVAWLLPYLAIWGGTAAALGAIDARTGCTGFCAVYAGFETYLVLLCAAVLSVVVASAEVYLGRAH